MGAGCSSYIRWTGKGSGPRRPLSEDVKQMKIRVLPSTFHGNRKTEGWLRFLVACARTDLSALHHKQLWETRPREKMNPSHRYRN